MDLPRASLWTALAFWAALIPAAVASAGAAGPAAAAGAAGEVSVEDLQALAATLDDETKRRHLAAQIRALIAAKKGTAAEPGAASLGAGMVAALSASARETGRQLGEVADALLDLPGLTEWMVRQATDRNARWAWIDLLIRLAAILLAGAAAEQIARRLLRRPRAAFAGREGEALIVRVPFVLAAAVLDLVPIAAFAGAAYAVLSLVQPTLRGQLVAIALINAFAIVRGLLALARIALVPASPSFKVFPVADDAGSYLYSWTRRFVALFVFGYFVADATLLLGLPSGAHGGLLRLLGLALAVLAIVFVMQNRTAVAAWLRGPETAAGRWPGAFMVRRRFADLWHVLAVIYVSGIYGAWALGIKGGFRFIAEATLLSALALGAARIALAVLDRLRAWAAAPALAAERPLLKARLDRYAPPLHLAARGAVYLAAALGLLEAWGIPAFRLLASPLAQRAAGAGFTIALVLVLALAVWEAIAAAVERYLAATDARGERIERSARARTLLPLLRNAVMIVLSVMVALIVLSELGVNIAPLLAGAGVVGLAVGVGAQKLVQDVINGAFILFEDTVAVGDTVDVGGRTGVVEAISIRSIRLRDAAGKVHTIPFSAVDTVVNMSRGFAHAELEIGIGYREDTDRVTAVLKEIGAEMQADPEFGPHILEPLEVLGVDRFADSAVVIKARFKTAPLKQWPVGREFNRRLKQRFDALGIEIPFPQRTVHVLTAPAAAGAQPASGRVDPESL